MKRLAAFTLAATLALAWTLPAYSQSPINDDGNARYQERAEKQREKQMKKAAKQQEKARKKTEKAQRKAMEKAQKHSNH